MEQELIGGKTGLAKIRQVRRQRRLVVATYEAKNDEHQSTRLFSFKCKLVSFYLSIIFTLWIKGRIKMIILNGYFLNLNFRK